MTIEVRKLAEPMLAEVVGADTTKPLSLDDFSSCQHVWGSLRVESDQIILMTFTAP